ncbi:golgin subfamily A member 7 [Exaiptasia diaphana]|uniref:Ras modification protein ERF4 n=1 Tax=Exaiptasia diaphana TaxID=2652724 RepID=A0A913X336_EXADI|nr:golgin subfamily A member 7 [Exaiptasia diaphana]KXJ15723.1 Golgin subfamily A member 7 [Exaiptasia diaphana]
MAPTQDHVDENARVSNKVYLQRDYSRGTACRFQNKFPTELKNRIDKELFEQTINHINTIFDDAERVGTRSYVEGCLGCLSAYLIYSCMTTQYDKMLKRLSDFITEQNQNVFVPRGLMITHPMERGLRVIEITILSPSDHR